MISGPTDATSPSAPGAVPWHLETGSTLIRKLCVGSMENNVYIIACARTGEAVIVDAASEADRIIAAAADLRPTAILTTHGHFDHIGAVDGVQKALGIPFLMHAADAAIAGRSPDTDLEEGMFAVGDIEIDVRHTPGHTPGSSTLVVACAALTGDTLFPGGPGMTRGTFDQVLGSIEHRIFDLDPATVVMPGHGLDTTIGTEAPALETWRRRGW